MARTRSGSIKRVGYTLKYETEFSGSFAELFKEGMLPLSAKDPCLSREFYLTVFQDSFELSNDLGLQISFHGLESSISLEVPKAERPQILSSKSFLNSLKRDVSEVTTHKIGSTKTYEIGSQTLAVELHHLYAGDLHYAVWIAKNLLHPVEATEILWRLMLGTSPPSPTTGLPVRVTVTDPKNPASTCFRCNLVEVEKASPDKKRGFKLATKNPVRSSPIREVATAPSRFSRQRTRDDPRKASSQRLGKRPRLHWPTGRYLTSAQSNTHLGVALNAGFLDRVTEIANSLSGLLGGVTGHYDYDESALEIDINLANRLQHGLAIDSETWEIQEDLIVAMDFLLGGYPVSQLSGDEISQLAAPNLDDYPVSRTGVQGGLTGPELEKWAEIRAILEDSHLIHPSNWQWQVPDSTEAQLGGELKLILTAVDFELSGGDRPADPSLDPLIKKLTLVLMFGFLRESTLGDLWAIISTFDKTVLPYGHPRASEYLQAHLGELLSLRLSHPHRILGGGLQVVFLPPVLPTPVTVLFDFGPILTLSLDFSQGDLVREFRHDSTELDLTGQIPFVFAEVAVNVRLRNKEMIILAAVFVDPQLWWFLLLEDSGSLILRITNTEFPLECRLPETHDKDDRPGLGLELSLNLPADETMFEEVVLSTENINDALRLVIAANEQRIQDELSDQLREQVDTEISRLFIDRDLTEEAGTTVYEKLLPWPDMIKLLNGPTLRSLETDTLSEKALWAAIAQTSLSTSSSAVGPLSLDDVDEIGYLLPEAVLATWVATALSMHPGWLMGPSDLEDWASGIGVTLPDINAFPEPADAIIDEEQAGLVGILRGIPFTDDDQQVPELPECAQNKPMVAAPTRFYRGGIERYRPSFSLPEEGQSAVAGEIVWTYRITLDAILRKEIAQLVAVEGGLIVPESDEPPKEAGHGRDFLGYERPPITSGQETGENGPLGEPTFPGVRRLEVDRIQRDHQATEADETGEVGFDCYWQIITREYVMARMVCALVELRGGIQLGFAPQNALAGLEADPLTSVAPTLGLALVGDNGGVSGEVLSLETGDAFAEVPQDSLESYVLQTCQDDANSAINASSLGKTQLSGLHYFIKGRLGSLGDKIVPAIRDVRLRQQGADVQAGMPWDPDVNEFSYLIQNGRLIWPVVFDFDLDSLIE